MAPSDNVMDEFKAGTLTSGSKSGPKVTDPKQAVAILMSEKDKENPAMTGAKRGPKTSTKLASSGAGVKKFKKRTPRK